MSELSQKILYERVVKSSKFNLKEQGMEGQEYLIWNSIPVSVSDVYSSIESQFPRIKDAVENHIPKALFDHAGIQQIVIDRLYESDERHYDAILKKNIIYIKPSTSSPKMFAANIVHEIGHSFMNQSRAFFLSDNVIKDEFLSKKIKFINLARFNWKKISASPFPEEFIQKNKYVLHKDSGWTHFIEKQIGPKNAVLLSKNFLLDPYSLTSIDEYFCVAFQYFWIENQSLIMDMCPGTSNKIANYCKKNISLRYALEGSENDIPEFTDEDREFFKRKKEQEEEYPHW